MKLEAMYPNGKVKKFIFPLPTPFFVAHKEVYHRTVKGAKGE